MGVGLKMVIVMFSITAILMFSGVVGLPFQNALINMTCENVSDVTNNNCTLPTNNFGLAQSNGSLIASVPMVGWFNPITLVWESIQTIIAIAFMPVYTLYTIGAPAFLYVMVGGLWSLMWIFATMSFLRGWDW